MSVPLETIQLQKLSQSYVEDQQHHILFENVDFSFHKRVGYAIKGHSGSGKTTLLMCIAGLEKPTHGNVYYDKKNIASYSEEEKNEALQCNIGLLFQSPYLLQELSVIQNVMIKSELYSTRQQDAHEQAYELLCAVGLEQYAYKTAWKLSGGQQQRVALARALMNKPDFLLADEPTGNLDEETGARIIEVLLHSKSSWKMGIIIATHDAAVAKAMDVTVELKDHHLISPL